MIVAGHKSKICEVIRNVKHRNCNLDNLINSIPIEDLQMILQNYVTQQYRNDKVAKMYYSTISLTTFLEYEFGQHILEHLQPLELFQLTRTSKIFNTLSKIIFNISVFVIK
eukprot:414835_1